MLLSTWITEGAGGRVIYYSTQHLRTRQRYRIWNWAVGMDRLVQEGLLVLTSARWIAAILDCFRAGGYQEDKT